MRRTSGRFSLAHTALKAKEWLELFMAGAHELMAGVCKEEVAVLPSDAAALRSLLLSGESIAEAFKSSTSSIDTLKANTSVYNGDASARDSTVGQHRVKLPAYPQDFFALANVASEVQLVSLELQDTVASVAHRMCGFHACSWSKDDVINISTAVRALEGIVDMVRELQDFPLDFFYMLEKQLVPPGSANKLHDSPTPILQSPTPTAAAVNTPARPQQKKRTPKKPPVTRAGPIDPTLNISEKDFDAILQEFSTDKEGEKAAEGDIKQPVVATPAAAATRRRRRRTAQRSRAPGSTVAVIEMEPSTPTPTPTSVAPARASSPVAAQAVHVEHAAQPVTEAPTPEGALAPSPSPNRAPCRPQAQRGDGLDTSSSSAVTPEPRHGAQDACIAGKVSSCGRRNSKRVPQREKEVMEGEEEDRLLAEAIAQARAEKQALENAGAAQNQQAHVRTRRRPIQARVALTRLRTSSINTA